MELEDQTEALYAVVKEQRPQRVVLDSLSELRLLAEAPFLYRRQLMSWQQFFAEQHCTSSRAACWSWCRPSRRLPFTRSPT